MKKKAFSYRRLLLGVFLVLLIIPSLGFGWYLLGDRPDPEAYEAARHSLQSKGIDPDSVGSIVVVDYSKASFFRRLCVYLPDGSFRQYLVCHGKNSGQVFATTFSDTPESRMSSLGLYRIGDSYEGKHGLSYRLHGLDKGINENALERYIVIHAASYVSYGSIVENLFAGEGPRLGKSFGCPAMSDEDYAEVMALVSSGSYWFHYHADEEWLGDLVVEAETPSPDALAE